MRLSVVSTCLVLLCCSLISTCAEAIDLESIETGQLTRQNLIPVGKKASSKSQTKHRFSIEQGILTPKGSRTDNQASTHCIVLFHGMARSSFSMKWIEKQLIEAQFFVINQSYPSLATDVIKLAKLDYVKNGIEQCEKNGASKISFVTHSLGGLLVKESLITLTGEQSLTSKIDSLIMLGPPNNGSDLVDRLTSYPLLKKVLSYFPNKAKIIEQLSPTNRELEALTFDQSSQNVPYKLGIIAGTKTLNPIFSNLMEGLDDGKVSISNTCSPEMIDWIAVPENHTTLMFSKQVIRQVEHFLNNHKFNKEGLIQPDMQC